MVRIILMFAVVLGCFSGFAQDADARHGRGLFNRRNRARVVVRTRSVATASGIHANTHIEAHLQLIAEQRANAMARLGVLSHDIQNYKGANCKRWSGCRGEGIGRGRSRTCATCVTGSRCVADAAAYSERTRTFYRVRLWR